MDSEHEQTPYVERAQPSVVNVEPSEVQGDVPALDSAVRSAAASRGPAVALSSRVQRSAGIGALGGQVDADTERRIERQRSGGNALAPETRSRMEAAMGADLGSVRMHTGAEATELSTRIQAKAFTTGNDVFFRDGAPNANSADGQRLLAHELTHVVQQRGAVARTIQREYVKCSKSEAENTAKDYYSVGSGKQQRNIYFRKVDSAPKGLKFEKLPSDEQPVGMSWGWTSVYELVPDETRSEEPVSAEESTSEPSGEATMSPSSAKKGQPAKNEKSAGLSSGKKSPSVPSAKALEKQRRAEKRAADQWKYLVGTFKWFGAYETAVKLKYKGDESERLLDESVVDPLNDELKKIDKALSSLLTAKLPLFSHPLKEGLDTTIGEDPPQPVACADPLGDLKVRVAAFVGLAATKRKSIGRWITTWKPVEADAKGLVAEFGDAGSVCAFVEALGGVDQYVKLRATRGLTPEAMKHYGAAWFNAFTGVDDDTWNHLVTAEIKHTGKISGAHDEAVFRGAATVAAGYTIVSQTKVTGTKTRIRYRKGLFAGWKTVIKNLATNKDRWIKDLNDAVWVEVAAMDLPKHGTANTTKLATVVDTVVFEYFYGDSKIKTVFPVEKV